MGRAGPNASDAIHDSLAADYNLDVDLDVASRLKYELTARFVRPTDRVLDVGCANGIHLRLIGPRCQSGVGIDINDRMLSIARETLDREGIENASVIKASAIELPFDSGEFDLAYSFSTLLLLPDPTVAVREIARVLRPGGTTILDFTGRYNLSQRHWRRWYREQGHFGLSAFSRRRVIEVHREAGLEPLELHGLGLTDQWKYVRYLNRLSALDRVFHRERDRDLDYALSNVPGLRGLANRWYAVARKRSDGDQ